MRATRSSSTRISAEGGFTVIELGITMMVLGLIVASILGIFISVQRSQALTQDRSVSLDQMRLAIERIGKELRQATVINAGSSASRLDVQTFVNGTAKKVVYEASGSSLTRTGDGSSAPVLDELASTSIFSYSSLTITDSTLVTITLTVNPVRRPDTTLELKSEIRLRNGGI